MVNTMRYMVTSNGLSVFFPGKEPFMVAKDHPSFEAILEAITSGKVASYEDIEQMVKIKKTVANLEFEGVAISLNDDEQLVLTINGKEAEVLSGALERRLVGMLRETDSPLRKATYQGFARFISNLYKNPSYKSVKQMYGFLEANDLPITQNGTFLAYKKVRPDYFDIHSGTFNNSIGQVVEMPRNMVEDDPYKTCSAGLHVCSYDYLRHYSSCELDRVVICEVNPADVVSIPAHYDNAKMRTCKYTVIDEVPTYFDAQLGSYVYGDHEDGWINKTFQKLADFYKKFFGVNQIYFSCLPDTISVTPVVIADFFKEAEAAVGPIPQKCIDIANEKEAIPTMKVLFQWLSKYDSNWKRPDNQTAND